MDNDLPDCILSLIFSKLSVKDQFKTPILSKHWLREWKLSSTHLNFDRNTLPTDLPSQFTARLDQFMLHYQHEAITSIRVKYPLHDQHSDVIDRLISQGIAKGVKYIQLLFSPETNPAYFNLEFKPYRFSLLSDSLEFKPYTFSFSLLSDSLTYLHLENCLVAAPAPMEFSGLKNLATLVLQKIHVKQDLLDSLFYNRIHLADFTLDNCYLYYFFNIISPALVHLKIVNCHCVYLSVMEIIAPNLSSLEYSCKDKEIPFLTIDTHALSHFSYRAFQIGFMGGDDMSCLKNLTTIVLDGICYDYPKLITRYLFQQCLQLENVTLKNCPIAGEIYITGPKLRYLNIIDCGSKSSKKSAPYMIYIDAKNLSSFEYSGVGVRNFSVMAPKLLEIFLNASVKHKKSGHARVFWHAAGKDSQFLHNEFEYGELHDCVCTVC